MIAFIYKEVCYIVKVLHYFQITLSVSRTGKVHFGDTAMLVNPAATGRNACVLAINDTTATASMDATPSAKTALVITR